MGELLAALLEALAIILVMTVAFRAYMRAVFPRRAAQRGGGAMPVYLTDLAVRTAVGAVTLAFRLLGWVVQSVIFPAFAAFVRYGTGRVNRAAGETARTGGRPQSPELRIKAPIRSVDDPGDDFEMWEDERRLDDDDGPTDGRPS
jgi:hypothetical protein